MKNAARIALLFVLLATSLYAYSYYRRKGGTRQAQVREQLEGEREVLMAQMRESLQRSQRYSRIVQGRIAAFDSGHPGAIFARRFARGLAIALENPLAAAVDLAVASARDIYRNEVQGMEMEADLARWFRRMDEELSKRNALRNQIRDIDSQLAALSDD